MLQYIDRPRMFAIMPMQRFLKFRSDFPSSIYRIPSGVGLRLEKFGKAIKPGNSSITRVVSP